MRDNEEAASTSGPQPAQTETGIILRTRSSGVLTDRVRNPGGGGGGRARAAGRGGGVFRVLARGSGGKGLGPGVGGGLARVGQLGWSYVRGWGLGSGVGEGFVRVGQLGWSYVRGWGLGSGVGEGFVRVGQSGWSYVRGWGLGSGVGEGLDRGVRRVWACTVLLFCSVRRLGAGGFTDRGCLRRFAGGRSVLPPMFIGQITQHLLAQGRFSGVLSAHPPGGGRLPGVCGPGRAGS